MDIAFHIDPQFEATVNIKVIENAVHTTVQLFAGNKSSTAGLTITITNNQTVAQLNHQYRGINAPTDVLSFGNTPDPDFPEMDPATGQYLGDIIIAWPVANAQADAGGHTVLDEITLLSVHGTLHLLGFDHDTPEHKNRMWAAQQQVMSNLGLAHIQPTEK